MKILLKILITIAFVGSLLGGLALTVKNSNEAASFAKHESEIAALEGLANALGGGSELSNLPTAGKFRFAMVLSILLALFSLVGVIAAFLKGKMMGLVAAVLVFVAALLLIIFEPSVGGLRGDPKPVAMTVGIIGIVGAALLGLLKVVFSKPAQAGA